MNNEKIWTCLAIIDLLFTSFGCRLGVLAVGKSSEKTSHSTCFILSLNSGVNTKQLFYIFEHLCQIQEIGHVSTQVFQVQKLL